MPSRILSLCIVLFWIATTGWMIQRDFLPFWLADEPPTYMIDLEDEVGAKEIPWTIYDESGKEIGYAKTQVIPLEKGHYQLRADLSRLKISVLGLVDVKHCTSVYSVDPHGHLTELYSRIDLKMADLDGSIIVEGKVQDGKLTPEISTLHLPVDAELLKQFLPELEKPIEVSGQGSVINIMHPFNKLSHLRNGKTWKVPVFNPLPAVAPEKPYHLAGVFEQSLDWKGEQVSCWRVDLVSDPKDLGDEQKDPELRIWVRQSDNLVLQHVAKHQTVKMIMKRAT